MAFSDLSGIVTEVADVGARVFIDFIEQETGTRMGFWAARDPASERVSIGDRIQRRRDGGIVWYPQGCSEAMLLSFINFAEAHPLAGMKERRPRGR